MPRVFFENTDQDIELIDLCFKCWMAGEQENWDYMKGEDSGEHPAYDETEYDCEVCHKRLTGRDD